MKKLRWLIMVPLAFIAMMLGSLLGGLALSVFGNQTATDTGSAFWGCFALVFAAGLIAPAKRGKTTLVFAGLNALFALILLGLSVATNIESFTDQTPLQKILVPVSQILGGLYAAFLLPPLVTPGALLEQLWKEIIALGVTVILFGIVISLGGLLARVVAGTWAGVATGLGVIALGVATWLFPFAHLFLRMRRLPAAMNDLMNQNDASSKRQEIR